MVFTVPLLAISMALGSDMAFSFKRTSTSATQQQQGGTGSSTKTGIFHILVPGLDIMTLVQFALATPVQFGSGLVFYKAAFQVSASM